MSGPRAISFRLANMTRNTRASGYQFVVIKYEQKFRDLRLSDFG